LEPTKVSASIESTDALFAENVEQKMSNPLAHFLAARLFLDRLTKLVRGREIRISRGGSYPTSCP
jgi:hypothetical protein